jgi:hypothetical protein
VLINYFEFDFNWSQQNRLQSYKKDFIYASARVLFPKKNSFMGLICEKNGVLLAE